MSLNPEPGADPGPGPLGRIDVGKLLEEQDRKRAAKTTQLPDDIEPWNQSTAESELEREVHLWFLELWPHGEYDWDTEQASLLSQVRIYGLGAYNIARVALLEKRKRGERIGNELAWLNSTAKAHSKTT